MDLKLKNLTSKTAGLQNSKAATSTSKANNSALQKSTENVSKDAVSNGSSSSISSLRSTEPNGKSLNASTEIRAQQSETAQRVLDGEGSSQAAQRNLENSGGKTTSATPPNTAANQKPPISENSESGPSEWTEVAGASGETWRSRTVPDDDGRGNWTEWQDPNGQSSQNRTYSDPDNPEILWSESIRGDNRWRQNLNAETIARSEGPNETLTLDGPKGPMEIGIHGATPEEMASIQRQLEALPPEMRASVREIIVADDIGQFLDQNGNPVGNVGGFADANKILLDRASVSDDASMQFILYHEMGHVKDFGEGGHSTPGDGQPWGNGRSVSDYGNRNSAEDYAESHRAVLQLEAAARSGSSFFPPPSQMSREQILMMYGADAGERYIAVLEDYGYALEGGSNSSLDFGRGPSQGTQGSGFGQKF